MGISGRFSEICFHYYKRTVKILGMIFDKHFQPYLSLRELGLVAQMGFRVICSTPECCHSMLSFILVEHWDKPRSCVSLSLDTVTGSPSRPLRPCYLHERGQSLAFNPTHLWVDREFSGSDFQFGVRQSEGMKKEAAEI
jgi:hypothetical protein